VGDEPGKQFRDAWIAGVHKHYGGEPKPGYVTPWGETLEWERSCAAATEAMIVSLLHSSDNAAVKLTREQKSQFVAACWTAQIYRQIAEPKPSYVATWDASPRWQREVDADIFDAVANNHRES
jgi:hypothetical protein